PIECRFSANVMDRLRYISDISKGNKPQYDEATNTFRLVPSNQSVYEQYVSIPQAMRVIENWVNTYLTKQLETDRISREKDLNCKLLFARNEMYEPLLEARKKRQMVINVCCVASFALMVLTGAVFFCQVAKKSELG
ncbi:MAG: hypothetical protein ACRDFB_10080, partial [Rhabdochlamydiaceae bacterium]